VSYRDRQYGYEFSSFNRTRGIEPIRLILVEQPAEPAGSAASGSPSAPPSRYRLTTFEEALPGAFSTADFRPDALGGFLATAPAPAH
jgi:hypothetical protein